MLIRSFIDLCVLTSLSREGYAVAKGGRGQLALLQMMFYDAQFHYNLYHPPSIRRADLVYWTFLSPQNHRLGRSSTG
ncbi:MAG: hypothetical protein EZS28_017321 [Streblomastix strix]|uniref:Uncharacterized protein n=1 Tax=Streblomastix strix TaxID=222440 RepID=A0A5J4VXT1_9EUKA|nr:MAG: hypothetical protein EZS28_017321 [Streblomastix strix]